MTDYNSLKSYCQQMTKTGASVLDNFLLHYAAKREKLEREMASRLVPYRHITQQLDPSWINLLMTQYIGHRVFKEGGLIGKYLNHSAVKDLETAKIEYLWLQARYPWKFSFSVICGNPAQDFYEMEDVFTGEKFLLFSPGVTNILSSNSVCLWFNLIAYNGRCWQSYGPIAHYQSFEPEDIRYFAAQLNYLEDVEDDADLMYNVEENPVPYMMLLSGATLPFIVHKEERIVHHIADYFDDEIFNTDRLKEHFKIEYNKAVYRLSLKEWSEPPHFSTLYYDEKDEALALYAMTRRGFDALVTHLNNYCGFALPAEPDLQINPSMFSTAEKILKKKDHIFDYMSLFEEPPSSPEDTEIMDKLNEFLALAMPEINSGRQPDVEALAKKTGLDPESAREIISDLLKKTGR